MELLIQIAIAISGLIFGFVLHELYSRFFKRASYISANMIIEKAEQEAKKIINKSDLLAKDRVSRKKELFEQEINVIKKELEENEKVLKLKEEVLEKKSEQLEEKESAVVALREKLVQEEYVLQKKESKIEELLQKELDMLSKVAGLSKDQATAMLLERMEDQLQKEMASVIDKHLERIKEEVDQITKEAVILAIQKCAVEHTTDYVVATINIPNDEMKGRIIGKEGRNIRSFERITGVNVIIDDTPGVVVVSCFDPIRREIARITLEKLIQDGRIHPARIEEVEQSTREELDNTIFEYGEKAAYEVGVQNLHPEQLQFLGQMKFHMIIGQNLLQHTIEITNIMAVMASEFNLDIDIAKRCGLLHKIGRVVDHQMEGHHSKISAEIAKKYNEFPEVVNAIASYHEAPQSLYAVFLQVSHNIVSGRPGAQKEALQKHIKRLKSLEEIALSFVEVDKAFAVQSGREIRCVICSEDISEDQAKLLCFKIARKIETDLNYFNEIKVTLSFEKRIVEYVR